MRATMTTKATTARLRPAPKVSFVSLGCPRRWSIPSASSRGCARKATSSRAHEGADLVIVNTCGFLDSAKAELLEAIGTAWPRTAR